MPVAIQVPGNVIQANQQPDSCPICHVKILPTALNAEAGGKKYTADILVTYRCPNLECAEVFIGYFRRIGDRNNPTMQGAVYQLINTRPVEPTPITFPDPIKEI